MTIAMPHTDPLRPQSPTAGLPAPNSGPAESEGTAESAGPASTPTLLSAVGLGYFPPSSSPVANR